MTYAHLISLALLIWATFFGGIGVGMASSFRCGTRIVSPGDTASEVIYKCGQPDHVETWEETRVSRDFYKNIPGDPDTPEFYREPFLVKEYVRVEEWEYNLGPTQFIRYLRFENGRLRRITTGGYGY